MGMNMSHSRPKRWIRHVTKVIGASVGSTISERETLGEVILAVHLWAAAFFVALEQSQT